MNKKYFIYIVLFFLLFFLFGAGLYFLNKKKELRVTFFDVGQGDSALIQTPNNNDILIDAGPGNIISQKIGEQLSFFNTTIEIVVITHPHRDHYSGLFSLLPRYNIEKVFITDGQYYSQEYLGLLKQLDKRNIKYSYINYPQDIFREDSLVFKALFPNKDINKIDHSNINNLSIVAKLTYKDISFLFTGDIEKESEDILIQSENNLNAQVLKIGHHGSKTSSTLKFLHLVNPQYAIISVGMQNPYGHPSKSVLQRLSKLKISILRTDLFGDIYFQSNGFKLNFFVAHN